MHYTSQLQSEVEDADIIECGADADCELSEVFTDAGLWPMTDAARTEIVIRGSAVIQNKSGPFATTVRASDKAKGCTRSLTLIGFIVIWITVKGFLGRGWYTHVRSNVCTVSVVVCLQKTVNKEQVRSLTRAFAPGGSSVRKLVTIRVVQNIYLASRTQDRS